MARPPLAAAVLLALLGCGARTLPGEAEGPRDEAPAQPAPDAARPTPVTRDVGTPDAAGADAGLLFVTDRFVLTDVVDVVWVVDQSPSMDDEITLVRDHLSHFATTIAGSGRDFRLVLLAARDRSNGLCVPEPLAGPGCADSDRFRQVDEPVGSHNALVRVQEHIGEIEASLRPGSDRAFVFVTDDEAAMSAGWFDRWVGARGGWGDYAAYAVVGIDPAVCPGAEGAGRAYQRLAELRRGSSTAICDPDWNRLVDRLASDLLDRRRRLLLSAEPMGEVRVLAGEPPAELAARRWRLDSSPPALVLLDRELPTGTTIEARYRARAE